MAAEPLVALQADPNSDVRDKSCRILSMVADKYPDFVGDKLAAGVTKAFDFTHRLWQAAHPGQPMPRGG